MTKNLFQRYKKIVDFGKKKILQESQNDTKASERSSNEQRTSEEFENNKEPENKEPETNKKQIQMI